MSVIDPTLYTQWLLSSLSITKQHWVAEETTFLSLKSYNVITDCMNFMHEFSPNKIVIRVVKQLTLIVAY